MSVAKTGNDVTLIMVRRIKAVMAIVNHFNRNEEHIKFYDIWPHHYIMFLVLRLAW